MDISLSFFPVTLSLCTLTKHELAVHSVQSIIAVCCQFLVEQPQHAMEQRSAQPICLHDVGVIINLKVAVVGQLVLKGSTGAPLVRQNRSGGDDDPCLLYTSPSPRDATLSRMPSSA